MTDQQQDASSEKTLLKISDLRTWFYLNGGIAKAVDGVELAMSSGATLAVVGESGCGKSVTALTLMRLVPIPPGRIVSGSIVFENRNLLQISEHEMQKIRGNRIGMIFQEPMTSLNPLYTAGAQVAEVYRLHKGLSRKEAWREAVGMMERAGIPSAASRAKDYPHHLSGGLRQRVMIAMALACNPALLIADEPTTALDVTIQSQILHLMRTIQDKTGTAIMLITHDLGVVAETAQHVVVMYAGSIVESAPVGMLFAHPAHPYTVGLLRSIPKIGEIQSGKDLTPIEGTVPDPTAWPEGCRFHPRCPHARSECRGEVPQLMQYELGHFSRCLFAKEIFG